jgi:NitT/TauT family transport system substrate-binding protein
MRSMRRFFALPLLGVLLLAAPVGVLAEVGEIRIAGGFGITNLPIMVMDKFGLIEKHGKLQGIELKGVYATLAGGANLNDAILAGAVDFGFPSPTSLYPIWARTRGTPNEVKAVLSVSTMPLLLMTRNPAVKSIRDLGEKDRCAVPSLRVSIQPILMRMAAVKEFGEAASGRFDPITVAVSHPEATQAMLSGAGEINCHFTSAPYIQMQMKKGIRPILNSYDVTGGPSTFVVAIGPGRFVNENPKAYAAFTGALTEAIDWINRNKSEAAKVYLEKSRDKMALEDVLVILNDPQVQFTIVPQKTMVYAEFMFKDGMIKVKAQSWKDYFFPNAHNLPGS